QGDKGAEQRFFQDEGKGGRTTACFCVGPSGRRAAARKYDGLDIRFSVSASRHRECRTLSRGGMMELLVSLTHRIYKKVLRSAGNSDLNTRPSRSQAGRAGQWA